MTFSAHARLLLRRAFKDFGIVRDMVLGAVIAVGTLVLQVAWQIGPKDWQEHRWMWVASFVVPFFSVLILHAAWRLISAPWRLHQDQERDFANQKSEIETRLMSTQQELSKTEEALKNEAPRLYLEYSPSHAAQFLNYSGLIVRNAGKRTGFKAFLLSTLDPRIEVRIVFDDMPIQTIEADKGQPVTVRTEYLASNGIWHLIGGVLGEQVKSCFERIEETSIPVTINYSDHWNREYATPCIIRCEKNFLGNIERIWCELV